MQFLTIREDISGCLPLREVRKDSIKIYDNPVIYEMDDKVISTYELLIQDSVTSKVKLFDDPGRLNNNGASIF